jgi:predicted DsbA family dithiol-disulfide isomerase
LATPRLTVFSDFSCPHSYLTESSLRKVGSDREIVYRAMELFPAPVPLRPPDPGELAGPLAALTHAEGLSLHAPAFRPRTRKAHEAARFARDREIEAPFRERVFSAYWMEGKDIGRIDVLMEIAASLGMEPEEMKIVLDIDRFGDEIARDTEVAHRLRVPGTPTLFIGTGRDARVLAGAHGAEDMQRWLGES